MIDLRFMNVKKKDDFSPKVARSIAIAELFLERLKKKRAIPLRTLRLMERRLASVHRLIVPIRKKRGSFSRLDSNIDSALVEIERAKARREWYLKAKKKVRTYGDSMLYRKKKSYNK